MSLTASQRLPPRPEDNAFSPRFPSAEESVPNYFDEFFEKELYYLNDNASSRESLSTIEQHLEHSPDQDSMHARRCKSERRTPLQLVRKGSLCLCDESPSQLVVEKLRNPPQAFVSPLHLDNTRTPRSITQPTDSWDRIEYSPTKSPADTSSSHARFIIREKTLSPTPMYARLASEEIREHEAWQQDFQKFTLCPDSDSMRSAMFAKYRRGRGGNIDTRKPNHTAVVANAYSSPRRYHYPFKSIEILESPYDVVHPRLCAAGEGRDVWQGPRGPYVPSPVRTAPAVPYLSDRSMTPPRSLPFSAIPLPTSAKNAGFHAVGSPRSALAMCDTGQPPVAPGLGICYPSPGEIGRAVPYRPEEIHYYPARSEEVHYLSDVYLPTPPPTSVEYPAPDGIPSTRNGSASPSTGSTSPEPLFRHAHRRSPSKFEYSRRSISRNGPLKETIGNSASPERKQNEERNRSRSRSRSRPRAQARNRSTSYKSKKGAKGTNSVTSIGSFDFVNFTPEDSAKLMADVSPSGSFKTKARREQEAKQKRKKLNDVAISAIRAAGGNVRELQRRLVS